MHHVTGGDPMHAVVFGVAAQTCAVPVREVESIIRELDVRAAPGTSPHVRGLADVRGRLLSIFDVRSGLGLPPAAASDASTVLVLREEICDVGLLVDDVAEVATIDIASCEPAPWARDAGDEGVVGMVHRGDVPVVLLDCRRLIGTAAATTPAGSTPPELVATG